MTELNFERARFNMVEQQIRTWDVLDSRVLDAIGTTPRELFVPEELRALAYTDCQIPLGHGQVMMKPILEARMIQTLDLQANDRVLEIGTGSGYVTALLAKLGREVHSVDIVPEFAHAAERRLHGLGFSSITCLVGDAAQSWEQGGTWDVIAITGSFPVGVPEAYKRQLAVGGRLFAIVGVEPVMEATLITRVGEQEWSEQELFETLVPALLNARQPPRFVL